MAADAGQGRGRALRALLAAMAVLVLLGSGAVELSQAVAAPSASAGSAVPAAPQDSLQGGGTAVLLRPGGLAAVPAPSSPGAGLLPGTWPHVAPHLVAEPQSRPPTTRPAAPSVLAAGSRAPPAAVGT